MADYGEIFCTAVNEIVKQQIGQINFDVTKDCTVVSVQNKKDSEYLVSDGSSTFKAYAAAGASYALGDQVLVSIPEGDYNKQKTIVNKIVSESSSPIGYVSPLDEFIAGTGNIIQVAGPVGIAANGPHVSKHLFTLDDEDQNLYYGFTKIALTAEFMTLLDNLGLITGEYGLKLIVTDASGKVADFSFSSSEMLGNPYMFNTYFYQECVFTMPDSFTDIKSIALYLYQDGNFTDGRNPLTYDGAIIDNIFVKNINVVLGFSSSHATSELVQLSVDNTSYESNDNTRYPTLQWFHLIDTGVFEPINISNWTAEKDDHCEIRWYQYEPGCAEADTDKYGDKNWKWLNQSTNLAGVPANYPFSFPITLSERKETEKIKVVTIYREYPLQNNPTYEKETYYTSNILEFKNITESTSGGTQTDEQVTEDLSLFFTDDSYGNYFWYDQNGMLIDSANQGSSKTRFVEIRAKGVTLSSDWESYKAIDWIKWEVPANDDSTMIIPGSSMGFSNPTNSILSALNSEVAHTNTGNFNFSAKVNFKNDTNAAKVDRVKVILSTLVNGSWDASGNRPISQTISTGGATEKEINTTLKITKAHTKIKMTLEYYKGTTKVEDLTAPTVSNISLKQATSFWVATKTKENGKQMSYAIKNNWTQNRDNNNIKCTVSVNGVPHVLTETLRFGPKGSSGTANTFLLEILDGKNALQIGQGNTLRIQALLIGGNGKRFTLTDAEKAKIEWTLIHGNELHMKLDGDKDNNFTIKTDTKSGETSSDIITIISQANTLPKDNYAILQAKYKHSTADEASGTTPDLYAFLPIPMTTQTCDGMQGATQILYNHQGVPKYSNSAYVAFSSVSETSSEWRDWQLSQDSANPNPVTLKKTADITTSYALQASPLYATKENCTDIIQDKVCVSCYWSNSTNPDKAIWWSQPVLIMQSQYDFAMLNSWDGSLTIDEENGIILATMLGAGKKDSNNKFSGVLMGDLKGGTDLNDTEQMTGVYGFDHGVMSYALREDGTGFFGAKKNGRIEFNGQHGAIHSYGWTPEYKTNYTKWTLDSSKASKGSVFDLDDGQLQLYADANNYLRYNDSNSGKLEMSLSGANIKLNDKTGNPGLSGYIDFTAKGLSTEFRRQAAYYATCSTGSSWIKPTSSDGNWKENESNKTKVLTLKNFLPGHNTDSNTNSEDVKINPLTIDDIFKDGITIAVTFTVKQLVKEVITKTHADDENDTNNPRDEDDAHIGSKVTYTGHKLYLSISDENDSTKTISKPIYINNTVTSTTNHFGWSNGATVYFTYNSNLGSSNEKGGWEVTDSGSYSNIVQTADTIYSEVSQIGGSLSSSIKQTAASIESEVRRYAGYVGTCEGEASDNIYSVTLTNAPTKNFEITQILKEGVGLAVKFTKPQSVFTTGIKIKIRANTSSDSYTEARSIKLENGGKFSWTEYSTIYFVYTNNAWQVSDAGNYSRITQTADKITAEVKRKAQYYGTCSTGDGTTTKTVTLKNPLKADPANNSETKINADDLYQTGVTIAVTFTNKQTSITQESTSKEGTIDTDIKYEYNNITYTTTGAALELKVNNVATTTNSTKQTYPIYMQNTATSSTNHFGWEAGSTIYFTFNKEVGNGNGGWLVSDSGSYSKITQTADMIKAQVNSLDNKYNSAITQTAQQIRLEVNQKANYNASCQTGASTSEKWICIEDYSKIKDITIQNGFTVNITFINANTADSVKFILCDKQATEATAKAAIEVSPNVKWEAGETLPFVYKSGKFVRTSLSNSAITQLATKINAEVLEQNGKKSEGFCWELTKSGFALKSVLGKTNPTDSDWQTVFNCTHDGLTITPKTFKLVSGDWNNGKVILSSSPVLDSSDNKNYYFAVGKSGSWMGYSKEDGLKVVGNITATRLTITDTAADTAGLATKSNVISLVDGQVSANAIHIKNSSGTTIFKASGNSVSMAGWTVSSTALKSGTEGSDGFIGLWTSYPNSSNYRLRIGSKFSVDKEGNLSCTGGSFTGSISGASGTFTGSVSAGGWTLNSNGLKCNMTGSTNYILMHDLSIGYYNANGTKISSIRWPDLLNGVDATFAIGDTTYTFTDGILTSVS